MALTSPRFEASGIQNCEMINFSCFKPLLLWYFVVLCYGGPRTLLQSINIFIPIGYIKTIRISRFKATQLVAAETEFKC